MRKQRVMEELPPDLVPAKDVFTHYQIAKLRLEIESLSKKNRWEPYMPFLPLVTTGVAVFGVVFGVMQYQAGQTKETEAKELEQRVRVQNQIRADQEEIVKFAEDRGQTLPRVSFLLGLLDHLLVTESGQQENSITLRAKDDFTESLVDTIMELDMENNERDVGFPLIALRHWTDYERYLRENQQKLEVILHGYVSAMRNLRSKNRDYISDMRYSKVTDKDTNKVTERFIVFGDYYEKPGEARLFRRFLEIYKGFSEHSERIKDPKRKSEIIREFASALCNESMAEDIWGESGRIPPCNR